MKLTMWRLNLVRKFNVSLRYKLMAAFLVLGLLPLLVISAIFYNQFYKSLMQNELMYSNSVIKQITDNFDRWLTVYEYTALDLINSQDFQEGITNYNDDFFINQKYMLKMALYAVNRPEIIDIAVYRSNDRLDLLKPSLEDVLRTTPFTGNELIGEDFYNKVVDATGRVIWSSGKVYNCDAKVFNDSIAMSRKILGFNSGKELGILIIHIDSKYIRSIYDDVSLSTNGYILIVDDNGKIISNNSPESIDSSIPPSVVGMISDKASGSFIKEVFGKRCLVTFATSSANGWKALCFIPMDSILNNIYTTIIFIIIATLIALAIIIILSAIITNVIFHPINKLKNQMRQVERGDMNISIQHVGRDEIGILAESFQNMIEKIKALMHQQEEEQKKLRCAELLALQSQINPHFLYNTLDVAMWYAKELKTSEIQSILLSLAQFYRIGLSSGSAQIPIANELEHVKSYIEIEKMRFEGKFDVEYDINDEILQCSIVKITLQPLIENAIKHGIRKRPGRGKITIRGEKIDSTVIIRIEDDGVGMTKAQLNSLFEMPSKNAGKGEGYGIRNVNDRLILQYGKEYGLKYSSVKGEGTRVDVIIPAG